MNQQMIEIGQQIRAQRKRLGLSLREVALRAKMSDRYLSEVERGKYVPSVPVAKNLAKVVGLPLHSLTLPSSRVRSNRSGARLELWDYLNRYFIEKGYMPTVREIMDALSFGSTSAVDYALGQIENWGWISRDPDVARGIRLHEIDNVQSFSRGLARLRQAIIEADPTCLDDGRFEEMMGSPQQVLEIAAALLEKKTS